MTGDGRRIGSHLARTLAGRGGYAVGSTIATRPPRLEAVADGIENAAAAARPRFRLIWKTRRSWRG